MSTTNPQEMTSQEIETYNTQYTNVSRGGFYSHLVSDTLKPYLRAWLIKKGLIERKALEATTTVLANAYRAGLPYIKKMNDDSNTRRFGTPSHRRNSGAISIDLETANSFGADTLSLLGNTNAESTENVATPSTGIAILGELSLTKMREEIARSADAVIRPRLDAAKTELKREIRSELDEMRSSINEQLPGTILFAIEEKLSTDIVSQKIDEIAIASARAEAERIINEQIPRRLEVRINGHDPRMLDASPRHKIFDKCLKWLARGQHVYLVGPAGTGKTHLFKQLAEALGRPVTILGQALTKYEFSGYMSPTGDYVKTLLRDAVENGHLLCIDEIDMSAAAAIGFLNSLTANRYVAFPDKMVDAHPDFVVLAAANTYGRGASQDYIGRNPLDAASLDRFAYEVCDYDETLEKQLFGNTPWTQYVHKVRNAVDHLRLRHVVSMRAIQRGLDGIALDLSADEICDAALWRGLDTDTIAKIRNIAGEFTVATPVLPPSFGHNNGEIRTNLDFLKKLLNEFWNDEPHGSKIPLIKFWRSVNHCGLAEAKNEIDLIIEGSTDIEMFHVFGVWGDDYSPSEWTSGV